MSCSTTRQATKAQSQTESNAERETLLEHGSSTDSSATVSESETAQTSLELETETQRDSDEEIVTTIREYDTSQPTDTVTGTPPLKREITQTRRKVDTERQTQTAGQTTERQRETDTRVEVQQTDTTALHDNSQQQETAAVQTETREKRGASTWQRILRTLGGLAVLAALVWLGWRLKRYL